MRQPPVRADCYEAARALYIYCSIFCSDCRCSPDASSRINPNTVLTVIATISSYIASNVAIEPSRSVAIFHLRPVFTPRNSVEGPVCEALRRLRVEVRYHNHHVS